jgi:hypothetical protein
MAVVPVPGFRENWTQKTECHAITNKYAEAASVVFCSATKYVKYSVTLRTLPDAHRLKWGENSERTSIVKSVEENTANFCKVLAGKPLFSAIYGMYEYSNTEWTEGRPGGECTGKTKWCNEQNLSGISGPGRRNP